MTSLSQVACGILVCVVTCAIAIWSLLRKAARNTISNFPVFQEGDIFFGKCINMTSKILLDTGCVDSVVGSNFLKKNSKSEQYKIVKAEPKSFSFGHEKPRWAYECAIINAVVGGKEINLKFYIIKDSDVPALLSIKAMKKMGAVLNLLENHIFFGDLGIHAKLKESDSGHLFLDLQDNELDAEADEDENQFLCY